MSRPTYFRTHERYRLKKWGAAHLVSKDQEKASLETECGRRFFLDDAKGDGEDAPTCTACRESVLGKPPRQHIPPGIGKLPQPKRRRSRTRIRWERTPAGRRLDQGGATEPMLGIMDRVLRFLPGRRGRR